MATPPIFGNCLSHRNLIILFVYTRALNIFSIKYDIISNIIILYKTTVCGSVADQGLVEYLIYISVCGRQRQRPCPMAVPTPLLATYLHSRLQSKQGTMFGAPCLLETIYINSLFLIPPPSLLIMSATCHKLVSGFRP